MSLPHLFHVSEEAGITIFKPRPSPSFFPAIRGDVVFGIDEKLLHNYLLPRDCPRVTYYAGASTSNEDKIRFMGEASFVVNVEEKWKPVIEKTVLYNYELPGESFELLDENAGYYISYEAVKPNAIISITNSIKEIVGRGIELRFLPELRKLAGEVANSTLQFSLIRMKNAQ